MGLGEQNVPERVGFEEENVPERLRGPECSFKGLISQIFRLRRQFFLKFTKKHTSSNNDAPQWVNFWENVL